MHLNFIRTSQRKEQKSKAGKEKKINGKAHWSVQRISMHYVNVFQFKIIKFSFGEVIFAVWDATKKKYKNYKELLIKKSIILHK